MPKKTTYLTELIERHEIWAATHANEDSDDETVDYQTGSQAQEQDNDLWDFGTVRQLGPPRAAGLKIMNESDTNGRLQQAESTERPNNQPRPLITSNTINISKETRLPTDTLQQNRSSPASNQYSVFPSPTRKAVAPPRSPEFTRPPKDIPLPPSPIKRLPSTYGQVQAHELRSSAQRSSTPQRTTSSDYDRLLQESLSKDFAVFSFDEQSKLCLDQNKPIRPCRVTFPYAPSTGPVSSSASTLTSISSKNASRTPLTSPPIPTGAWLSYRSISLKTIAALTKSLLIFS